MRLTRWIGPSLIVAGAAVLSVALTQGEATLSLFVIFPVITAAGPWAGLGILLLVAGFFALFLTLPLWFAATGTESTEREPGTLPSATRPPPSASPRRWGGVVFLGPVPIVFGSDATVAKWMILVSALLFVALVVLTVIALRGI